MAKDLYNTLGLKRGATDKEIRKAYRQLARKHHPDVNPDDKAAEGRFKEVNAAYEVLKDAEKRKNYDQYGENWEHAEQFEAARRAGGSGRVYRSGGNTYTFEGDGQGGFEDLGGGLGDILGGIFGRRGGGGPSRRPANLEQPVAVTLEEAYQGSTRILQLNQPAVCATCGGAGQLANALCHTCGGQGVVQALKRIEVKIPAGVRSGSRVRVAGKGGSSGNGQSADLILVISVLPHTRFERRGDDLYTDVEVQLADALLGGEVAVPTIKGSNVMLRIPEATQNGRSFRLRGLGMPHLGAEARGDLFARVSVQLPESLSAEEKVAAMVFKNSSGNTS